MRRPTFTDRLAASAVFMLVAIGCGGSPAHPSATISPKARAYLDEVFALMESNSINRFKIDWAALRSAANARATSAQTIVDTYPAITEAIRLLGDNHTYVTTAQGGILQAGTLTCRSSASAPPVVPSTIGYVKVPSFSGGGQEANAFALSIQNQLRAGDRADLIGWIVDLRDNFGGNMWPMIAGLGAILGEGTLGYFIDPTGAESRWEYRSGASWLDGAVAAFVSDPYRLIRGAPRVAVLTDNAVASSGEATAIAFRGRPNTRFFGLPTCGISTANIGFKLSDGATLVLTVSVMADRTRTPYGASIEPDERITDPRDTGTRAVEWLQGP